MPTINETLATLNAQIATIQTTINDLIAQIKAIALEIQAIDNGGVVVVPPEEDDPYTSINVLTQQVTKLTSSDLAHADNIGCSVSLSIDGTTALVGASGGDDTDDNTGSAYIFAYNGTMWVEKVKLVANDPTSSASFGSVVSLSDDGNIALIGAYISDGGVGAAYVFTRSGSNWSQQTKLVASDGAATDHFGKSIALSGDGLTACIGNGVGSVYVFRNTGASWYEEEKIVTDSGNLNDSFGAAITFSKNGTTMIVGACSDSVVAEKAGACHVFQWDGSAWSKQATLYAEDGVTYDWFGTSVDLSGDGDTAIIGTWPNMDFGTQLGKAYIFTRNAESWTQKSILISNDREEWDSFGSSVSLSSNGYVALIGASTSTDSNTGGSAYVFTQNEGIWSQQMKLTPTDSANNDRFGSAVSLSGDGSFGAIGAFYNKNDDKTTGAAYIFSS